MKNKTVKLDKNSVSNKVKSHSFYNFDNNINHDKLNSIYIKTHYDRQLESRIKTYNIFVKHKLNKHLTKKYHLINIEEKRKELIDYTISLNNKLYVECLWTHENVLDIINNKGQYFDLIQLQTDISLYDISLNSKQIY